MISVAAELAEMHPQTLRMYEQRGLIEPKRSPKGTRLYSHEDVEKLNATLLNHRATVGLWPERDDRPADTRARRVVGRAGRAPRRLPICAHPRVRRRGPGTGLRAPRSASASRRDTAGCRRQSPMSGAISRPTWMPPTTSCSRGWTPRSTRQDTHRGETWRGLVVQNIRGKADGRISSSRATKRYRCSISAHHPRHAHDP